MIMPPLVSFLCSACLWVKLAICCYWESAIQHRALMPRRRNFYESCFTQKVDSEFLDFFSGTSSGASINFSYVGDKIHGRQPSCNKWYHLKMGSYDCHILKCTVLCWGGGCTNCVDVDPHVCHISGFSRKAVTLLSEGSFKSSSC